jgi:hypothetical protein
MRRGSDGRKVKLSLKSFICKPLLGTFTYLLLSCPHVKYLLTNTFSIDRRDRCEFSSCIEELRQILDLRRPGGESGGITFQLKVSAFCLTDGKYRDVLSGEHNNCRMSLDRELSGIRTAGALEEIEIAVGFLLYVAGAARG